MALVDTVRSLLSTKGNAVWALSPDATMYEAISLMALKGVGALLVMSGRKIEGIISERDYARKVILQGRSSKETLLRAGMSTPVFTVTPDHTVDECMHIVTERRIRHLPVVEGGEVIGIVSIGDLVRSIISSQAATIDQLHRYISGKYPG